MRIVGGSNRGRALVAPKGEGTRPTTDRTRETIFNILAHNHADALAGRVLDLFAGTGALGLEALSRGADFALFVEERTEARAALRTNIAAHGALGRTRVWRRDATRLGPCTLPPFSLILCDPPYGKTLGEKALAGCRANGWATDGAMAVLEERRDALPETIDGWELIDRRGMGETEVGFFTRAS
ncbi:MAG: 16S rRNA (guanine(966)-N(2))-methyltransferase RsmD [Pseudomonadota bacterium]